MLFLAGFAGAFLALITFGAITASRGEDHIVPEAFEVHEHHEEEEINPSEKPFSWWLKVTAAKL